MKNKHANKRLERLFTLTDTLQQQKHIVKYSVAEGVELYKPKAVVKASFVRG